MEIKVLGTGCASCNNTFSMIEQVAQDKGVPIEISKVDQIQDIMSYGVMSIPSVVVNGKVVHSGGMPSREDIESWFA